MLQMHAREGFFLHIDERRLWKKEMLCGEAREIIHYALEAFCNSFADVQLVKECACVYKITVKGNARRLAQNLQRYVKEAVREYFLQLTGVTKKVKVTVL